MKRILTIFLAIFVGLSMSAQIQRTFLDFTLGSTTKSEVYNKYKNEKLFTEDDNGNYAVGGLVFAGQKWDLTTFAFYKNKLLYVHFALIGYITPENILNSVWDDIRFRLLDKYADYNYYLTSEYAFFKDGKTQISCSYYSSPETNAVALMYTDEALENQQKAERDSEL